MANIERSLQTINRKIRAIKREMNYVNNSIIEYSKSNPSESILTAMQVGLKQFSKSKQELNDLHNQIWELLGECSPDEANKIESEIFEERQNSLETLINLEVLIGEVKQKIRPLFDSRESNAFVNNHANNSLNASVAATELPKLPKIAIPTFDGNVRKFSEYRDLFETLVHNNATLANIQKLYYLKNSLRGDATTALCNFDTKSDCYETAWEFLCEQYENRRLVIQTHFSDFNNIPSIKTEKDLVQFVRNIDAIVSSLKTCGINKNTGWSPYIAFQIINKLDHQTKRDWENSLNDNSCYPLYEDLYKFLKKRCTAIQNYNVSLNSASFRSESFTYNGKGKLELKKSFASSAMPDSSSSLINLQIPQPHTATLVAPKSPSQCIICKQNHYLNQCTDFITKSPIDRFHIIKSNNRCINCLNAGHKVTDCKSSTCRICKQKHHTLLHRDAPNLLNKFNSNTEPSLNSETKITTSSIATYTTTSRGTAILPTATVHVKLPNQKVKIARVLFDSASEVTLVSESFVKKHNIQWFKNEGISIIGITDNTVSTNYSCELTLQSKFSNFELKIVADLIPKLPSNIQVGILEDIQKKFTSLDFADTNIDCSTVDILIGVEYLECCFLSERKFDRNLTFRKTHFGWVISGQHETNQKIPINNIRYCELTKLVAPTIEDRLLKFWEIEQLPEESSMNAEQQFCSNYFQKTISRDKDGRFVARLPYKINPTSLGNSKDKAIKMLTKLEKNLPTGIKSQYVNFMMEYANLGHMERIDSTDKPDIKTYYIPHRAVLRPSSSSTKLRVVFNASSKTTSGLSLNEILATGPKVQPDLFDILIRFRSHKYAVAADIEKMYRQILIAKEDRDLQRIVWRNSACGPIQEFRLCTVTYGTAPASFIAQSCLVVLANEAEPKIAKVIRNDFYMDDVLTGAETEEELISLQLNLTSVLSSAGFPLHKFMSNSTKLLQSIDSQLLEPMKPFEFSEDASILVLGLIWNPLTDDFKIKVNLNELPNQLSKRTVLSEISKIYDPLGFISPITITAKIFLQDLWKLGSSWDDPLPSNPDLNSRFRLFYKDLSKLNNISIKRCYSDLSPSSTNSLVGFADASEKAYCAVVYFRRVCNSIITSYLVCAKTRVAPLKALTIPRLELQAALLLAQMLVKTSKLLGVSPSNITAFSDSSIALGWINQSPDRWNIFVANRVSKIINLVPKEQWFYVNTESNPADLATRGIPVSSLINKNLWFHGPKFLGDLEVNWNIQPNVVDYTKLPEGRKEKVANVTTTSPIRFIEKYSSFNRLLNVVSYLYRFYLNCKSKAENRNYDRVLRPVERSNAFYVLIRYSQQLHFFKEIEFLKANKELKILFFKLRPYFDSNQILRVGGRLSRSTFSDDIKFPIIWSANCFIFKMFIRHIHESYFHCNRTFLVNFIKAKFWVLNGLNNTVKRTIFDCTLCKRFKAEAVSQLMADLPSDRIKFTRAFEFTGIDFAGPFSTRCTNHRTFKVLKSYAAFFVCFVTRAVHIEIVSDLSTAKFIDALTRFIALRGAPAKIWTDNATNFQGARNLLIDHKDILNFLSNKNIDWQFITPRAPHHGGVWEAAIKAGKALLIKAARDRTLSFEDYATTFAQIAAILNSRPLDYRKISNDNISVVTPSHFLHGSALLNLTLKDNLPSEPNLLDRSSFDTVQAYLINNQIIKTFWTEWRTHYLNELQIRHKWYTKNRDIAVGDVVIVKEDHVRPADWCLGLIVETYPDGKGNVRTLKVRTLSGTKIRAIDRIIVLVPLKHHISA